MYPDRNFTWLHYLYMLGGVYNPEKFKSRIKRWICRLYNFLLIGYCLIYFFPSEISYLDQTMENLYEFLKSIGLLFTHCLGTFKWLVMLRYDHELERIKKELISEEYHYEDYKNFKPGQNMFKCRKFGRWVVTIFVIFGHFVGLTRDINFIYDFFLFGHYIETGNVTCLELLPYYNYIPFNIDTYWRCISGFLVQAGPVSGFVGPIIAFDTTFSVVTIYICGNLINIRDAFRTMRERCLVRLKLPEDYKVHIDSDNPALEKEIASEVRKLSIHLQQHIEIVYKMEYIFNYGVLAQAMTSLFALVSCLYIVSVESSINPALIAQVQYAISINIQLFNYCFIGDAITEWSSDVARGIYDSDWLSCTKTVKMSLMINLMRLQKPIFYTIGKFSPLTLNTFLQILKGSYSYFTFLQKT